MKNPFSKFERFGSISDFETRKIIANTIFNKLLTGLEEEGDNTSFLLKNEDAEYFGTMVDIILTNPVLREMTNHNPELAEITTREILDFIHQTNRLLTAFGNPFEEEVRMADSFSITKKYHFKSYWKLIKEYLNTHYEVTQINTAFYTRQFNKTFKASPEDELYNQTNSYESIRDHLTDKWKQEILLKLEEFQKEKMDEAFQQFTSDLFERMEYLSQMNKMMQSMVNNFNQIFDMPDKAMSQENFEVLKKYHDLLKMNHAVKELVKMLGRMSQAQSDAEKTLYGAATTKFNWVATHASRTDLVGIRESNDLNNLLPSETVLLSHPALQTLFFKKFAEKKLQTFEFEDRTKNFHVDQFKAGNAKHQSGQKGPFIICVDTSGSMLGIPETIAKTICLALLKIALRENRGCYLITFSTNIITLDLTNLKNNMKKIVDFLQMSFHGGTDVGPALEEATLMLQKQEFTKADVLVISDFEMLPIHPTVLSKIKSAKENLTRFHSLLIGRNPVKSVIDTFDHHWHFDPSREDSIFQLEKNLREL